MKPYTIAACLMHKDENDYLDEWLNYHRSIGISKFYIYDNDSLVNPELTITDLSDVIITNWPGDHGGRQVAAYEHLFDTIKPIEDWVAFIDTDEFIIIKPGNSLQHILENVELNGGGALGINWICFGSSGYIDKPASSFDYNMHSDLTDPINKHIKSIVKTGLDYYKVWNAHTFGVRTLNENMNIVTDAFTKNHSSNQIYIRHNLTRSREEFRRKTFRGDGNLWPEESRTKWQMNQWEKLCAQLNKCELAL